MILVHTVLLLSLIAASGFAAPQASDAASKESTTEPPKSEPPKAEKVETKTETPDAEKAIATKLLKEGIENSGSKITSDESLNAVVDRIVEIIHGERGLSPKAEALPLPIGDKYDFLLLKLPKVLPVKETKTEEKPTSEPSGARSVNLASSNVPNPPCNTCCPCAQQNYQQQQLPAETPSNPNIGMNSIPDNNDCPQSQQYQAQVPAMPYRPMNDYEAGFRGLLDLTASPQQRPDLYGYNSNYYNNIPQYQNNPDTYGTPLSYLSQNYPEAPAQLNSKNWNNNLNLYGFPRR